MKKSRLKPSPPPARNTPLEHHAELTRSTPMRRTTGLSSSGPIKAKRLAMSDAQLEAKLLVTTRSGGLCELRVPGVCLGRARDFSHRWAEGQTGLWCASNGLASCGLFGCHRWVHDHPTEAKRWGWIIAPTYRLVDGRRVPVPPAEFPALIWRPRASAPRFVLLDDLGGAHSIDHQREAS